MNNHLKIMGVDRDLFLFALFTGWAFFAGLGTLSGALVGGGLMMALGAFKAHDPLLLIVYGQSLSGRYQGRYSPAARRPFFVTLR